MVESINNVNKLHVQQQNNSKKNGAIDAKKQPISFKTGEKSGTADGKGVILERSLNDNKATGADGVAGAVAGVAGGVAGGVSNKKDENGCIEFKRNIVEKKKYEYKDFMPMPNKPITEKERKKYEKFEKMPYKPLTEKERKKFEKYEKFGLM